MLLEEIARTSEAVAATASRLAKVRLLAGALHEASPEEVAVAVVYLSGELPGGTVGVGWASLREPPLPADRPSLGVLATQATLERIRGATGPGSQRTRRELLAGLLSRATAQEQRFLRGLLLGELRQGALEGVMVEAVAAAAEVPSTEVRRALMLAGDLGAVAGAAVGEGRAGLARFRLEVLRPLQPMLAQSAEDVPSALARIGAARIEWKMDGARIQVHRSGREVAAFTRNLADVTDRLPEVVEAVSRLPLDAALLDGEAIALRPGGRPHPFQVTMSRFGSRIDVARLRSEVPLSAYFFDLLHLDGEDLLDRPLAERADALAGRLPEDLRMPALAGIGAAEGEAFLEAALDHGHEGVMVKALTAPYEAGRRGASWLKVKRAHTLDLVVLAAEWGHGRRRGYLSNLHLGARDPASGGFVMLGKSFKGLTDAMLAWQTERLLELQTSTTGHVVHVRPGLVVEVAFDGVQSSVRYPGGLALRFARVKGYRHDKAPADADTIDAVRAIHGGPPEP